MKRKRKLEPEVIVWGVGNRLVRLRKSRAEHLGWGGVYHSATKKSVRLSLEGATCTRVKSESPDFVRSYVANVGNAVTGKSLGCIVFRGANLAKLRKWAGVK